MTKISGIILAVNISQKKGERKTIWIADCFWKNMGLETTRSGAGHPEVSLLARES
jgi:hypothetical protein